MLETVDGVILAVRNAEQAIARFEELFDARYDHDGDAGPPLGARMVGVTVGTDSIHLAQPTGDGLVRDHIEKWGEGIIGVVFTARDVGAVAERLRANGVEPLTDGTVAFIPAVQAFGLHTLVLPPQQRERVGLISFIYEVTHLVNDWKAVTDWWAMSFGLDGMKFSPISSKQYGYDGMLTLFDPPNKLDRIEAVTPYGDGAMNRFFQKRGEGPYMFYMETDDPAGLRKRLDEAGARYAAGADVDTSSIFIHPSATHGVLIGVSPKNQAWVWSGRPELAKQRT
jgi:catechol 2,3-dioxygenase-like lactoylglutathione lyase family enzyme